MAKRTLFTTGWIIIGFMSLGATFQVDFKSVQKTDQVVTLTGTVLDAEREVPIPNAEVTVKENQESTKTGDTGVFTFEELKTGTFTLEVQAVGYERKETKVELSEGEDKSVEVKLTANY